MLKGSSKGLSLIIDLLSLPTREKVTVLALCVCLSVSYRIQTMQFKRLNSTVIGSNTTKLADLVDYQ